MVELLEVNSRIKMPVPQAFSRPMPAPLTDHHEELVQLAIDAYNSGRAQSLRQAAKEHNVDRETVRRRFNGVKTRENAHHSQQILTQDEERL